MSGEYIKEVPLGEILGSECVVDGMTNRSKKSAIEDLVSLLYELKKIGNKSEALKRVFEREELATTALGEGIAIPHARLDVGDKPVIAVGRHNEGIDFDAPDGRPVNFIFLVLWAPERPGLFNRLFAGLITKVADAEFRSHLAKAAGAKEIASALSDIKVDMLAGKATRWEADMLIALQLLETKRRAGAKDLAKKIELARAELSGSMLSRFDRLMSYHGDALAEAPSGYCMGCNMQLSTGLAQEILRNPESVYVCERCGRFLISKIK